ncbi:hypothetical protein [Mycobacterium colombiense]|uniref:hypothetical protein n=1 Tax=Mycobacterium colombiense TaxID=339268 RepID=UPI0010580566|nr:hypothetical protein [Mycobacterium colombiense]
MKLYHFIATERDTERYEVGQVLTVELVGFDPDAGLPIVENVSGRDQFTVEPYELRKIESSE